MATIENQFQAQLRTAVRRTQKKSKTKYSKPKTTPSNPIEYKIIRKGKIFSREKMSYVCQFSNLDSEMS